MKTIWFAIVQDGKKVQASPQEEALSPKLSCSIYPLSAISVLKVTIPLDALQALKDDTTTLPVSLPMLLYTTGIVKSLDLLLGRILQAGLLPQGILHISIISPHISRSPLLCSLPFMFQRVGVVCICITVSGWIASSPVEVGSTEKLLFCKLHFQSPESAHVVSTGKCFGPSPVDIHVWRKTRWVHLGGRLL